jgi:ubiquinone/menaquinone biosynthesis C-methylase UbiE
MRQVKCSMRNTDTFEKYAQEYDKWFDENKDVYKSEIMALRDLIPREGVGLEVGVGTGRFATPLGIKMGVEPAKAMADMARKRGIDVHEGRAEALPFDDDSFDFVLMMTTICFLEDPLQALEEAKRVLKPEGHIIIGMIDRDSPLGMSYERKKTTSKFYKYANFHSADEVLNWLRSLNFGHIVTRQTIFKSPDEIDALEPFEEGHGKGAFVAISAQKMS